VREDNASRSECEMGLVLARKPWYLYLGLIRVPGWQDGCFTIPAYKMFGACIQASTNIRCEKEMRHRVSERLSAQKISKPRDSTPHIAYAVGIVWSL
jgi:hypothetical protein